MLKNLLRLRNTCTLASHSFKSRSTVHLQASTLRCYSDKKPVGNEPATEPPNQAAPTKSHFNPFATNSETIESFVNDKVEQPPLSAEEKETRLKVFQLELDIALQEGRRVPSLDFMQPHHWDYVLTLPTKSARMKYYIYLWKIDVSKQSKETKKLQRAAEGLERREQVLKERAENNHIIYGLSHTSMFLRIYDTAINQFMNNRLIQAMQFSPKIVLDCSYDEHMNNREAINASKQLMLCFAENRAHDEPFDLHYCNVNLKTPCMQSLQRYIPTMLNAEFPMNVHQQCYTQLFPKEQLVYLTPHCRENLSEYNPDDVYIVGAMVDTVNNAPLSLAKAKKLGLRMARLPLDHYLQWGAGSGKSLTLNQMINIMLDLKKTGNWQQALRHVPRRKILNISAEQLQQKRILNKRAERLNINISSILKDDDYNQPNSITINSNAEPKVRSKREHMQFDLSTWGSKKKNRNSN